MDVPIEMVVQGDVGPTTKAYARGWFPSQRPRRPWTRNQQLINAPARTT